MRKQRVRGLRRLVARNHAGMAVCCGDDLTNICEECTVKYNVMRWGLQRLAKIFKHYWSSEDFVWLETSQQDDGSLCMKLKPKVTFEIVDVWIAAKTVKKAKEWIANGGKPPKIPKTQE